MLDEAPVITEPDLGVAPPPRRNNGRNRSQPKATPSAPPAAQLMCVYLLGDADQLLVDEENSEWPRPQIRAGDVALYLGAATYLLLRVTPKTVQRWAGTIFRTTGPIGRKVPWKPGTRDEFLGLQMGHRYETPMLLLAIQAMRE